MQKGGLCCRISFVDAKASFGGVAQLGEHHVRNVGVKGSNPSISIFFLEEIAWIKARKWLKSKLFHLLEMIGKMIIITKC